MTADVTPSDDGAAECGGGGAGGGGRGKQRMGGGEVSWQQVLLALAFLLVFGLSFAVAFEYFGQARLSLEADMVGPANCSVRRVSADANVSCSPSSGAAPVSACYSIFVDATYASGGDGDFVERNDCLLLDTYHSYYTTASPLCSYTLCSSSSSGGSPGHRLRASDLAGGSREGGGNGRQTFSCWIDRRKSAVVFVELQDERSSLIFFSRPKAYAVLVAPPVGMCLSLLAVVACIATGKVRAGELVVPLVTPNHVEIGGKWYLRSPRSSPVEPEDKWQRLKEALQ